MHVEWLSHWSGQLNREMPLNRYGHAGLPIVVFSSSGGTHNEYADFGMIDACRDSIEAGRIQFFTLASVDRAVHHGALQVPRDPQRDRRAGRGGRPRCRSHDRHRRRDPHLQGQQ